LLWQEQLVWSEVKSSRRNDGWRQAKFILFPYYFVYQRKTPAKTIIFIAKCATVYREEGKRKKRDQTGHVCQNIYILRGGQLKSNFSGQILQQYYGNFMFRLQTPLIKPISNEKGDIHIKNVSLNSNSF